MYIIITVIYRIMYAQRIKTHDHGIASAMLYSLS